MMLMQVISSVQTKFKCLILSEVTTINCDISTFSRLINNYQIINYLTKIKPTDMHWEDYQMYITLLDLPWEYNGLIMNELILDQMCRRKFTNHVLLF